MKHLRAGLALAILLSGLLLGQLSQSGGPTPPVQCTGSAFVEVTVSGTVQLIAGQPGKSIYVCGFLINSAGNTTARLVHGTGTNCGTSAVNVTPAFKLNNAANVQMGGSIGHMLRVPTSRALCLQTTASPDVNVLVTYAQF